MTTWIYSTENEIATVQAAGERDVNVAVRAAHEALKHPSWKLLPVAERGILLSKLADLIEENRALFATIDAWDNGEYRPFSLPSFFFFEAYYAKNKAELTLFETKGKPITRRMITIW